MYIYVGYRYIYLLSTYLYIYVGYRFASQRKVEQATKGNSSARVEYVFIQSVLRARSQLHDTLD